MSQNIVTAVIIDDEPEAIRLLEMFLRHFPNVEVVGKESNSRSGLELIKEKPPELLFLDIDMPDLNGLTVASNIRSVNNYTEIVFTTAHPRYAYDALDIEPLDFLSKPFSIEDLKGMMKKYDDRIEKKNYKRKLDNIITVQPAPIVIKLPSTKGVFFTDIKDIVMVKAKLIHCEVYLADGTIETVIRSIGKTISLINSSSFFQISRSVYINLNYLHRIDRKNPNCVLNFNGTLIEEKISRGTISILEKTVTFPYIIE